MTVTLNALPVTVSRAATRAAPRRSAPARTARAPVAVRASAHAKTPESRGSLASVGRGIALGAATLSVTLAAPPSAHAMEGVFANPAGKYDPVNAAHGGNQGAGLLARLIGKLRKCFACIWVL